MSDAGTSEATILLVGLQWHHRIGLLIASLLFVGLVLEVVRRGRLKERYALLWLSAAALGLVIGLFPSVIIIAAELLRFQYLTVVSLLAFVFLMGLVLVFSMVISRLSELNRELAQEVALLDQRLRALEPDAPEGTREHG